MTNERMFGLFLRTMGVPVVLLFFGFSCYSIFMFWQQEAIAKELYTWQPVVATDYEIKKIDNPTWPSDRPSEQSEEYEAWMEAFETQQRIMQTMRVNEYTIGIKYQYEYKGETREGNALSPFLALNQQALRNPEMHRYLLREDHPPLTVYVDPDAPSRSALVRGWAQGNRWGALVLGGVLLPLSLTLLYFLVRPVRKIEELFTFD